MPDTDAHVYARNNSHADADLHRTTADRDANREYATDAADTDTDTDAVTDGDTDVS